MNETTITLQAAAVRPLRTKLPDETECVEPLMSYFCPHCLNEYSSDEYPAVCRKILAMNRAYDRLLRERNALLDAAKGLMANADLCFDDLKELGAISRPNAMDYRKYRERVRAALALGEKVNP